MFIANSREYLNSDDLALLGRVLEKSCPQDATSTEREFRAATLMRLFEKGYRSEAALIHILAGEHEII